MIIPQSIKRQKCFNSYHLDATKGLNNLLILTDSNILPVFYNETLLHPDEYFAFWKSSRIYNASVETNKIVGTSYSDYCGKTWLEMLGSLNQFGQDTFKIYSNNRELFILKCVKESQEQIKLRKYADKYFIDDGNNRICTAKFLGIKEIECRVTEYEPDEELENIYSELTKKGYKIYIGSRDVIKIDFQLIPLLEKQNDNWLIETPDASST